MCDKHIRFLMFLCDAINKNVYYFKVSSIGLVHIPMYYVLYIGLCSFMPDQVFSSIINSCSPESQRGKVKQIVRGGSVLG